MGSVTHHYVSTACQHGFCDECRERCKFCGNPCLCRHHSESAETTWPPAVEHKVAFAR